MDDSVKYIDDLSTRFDDEEDGFFVGVPLSSNYILVKSKEQKFSSYSYWATTTISFIQILSFLTISSITGFAPLHLNPFIGPSLEDLDKWGSKNAARIIDHDEYWRILTAMFLNVGMMDLLVSIAVLVCLGYHLEKRWGSWKFIIIYVLSGIGGNIFGTLYVPTAISVGSGGCIFGLLGAMHVDIVFLVIHEHFLKKSNTEEEENEDDEEEENALLLGRVEAEGNKEYVEMEGGSLQDSYVLRSSYIILGFLGGIAVSTLMGILYPQSLKMQKDWAVLYGGMMSGLIVSLLWQFCIAIRARKRYMVKRVFFGFLIVAVPFAFDCFFSLEISHTLLKIM